PTGPAPTATSPAIFTLSRVRLPPPAPPAVPRLKTVYLPAAPRSIASASARDPARRPAPRTTTWDIRVFMVIAFRVRRTVRGAQTTPGPGGGQAARPSSRQAVGANGPRPGLPYPPWTPAGQAPQGCLSRAEGSPRRFQVLRTSRFDTSAL